MEQSLTTKKYLKKCLAHLTIREIQIKTLGEMTGIVGHFGSEIET